MSNRRILIFSLAYHPMVGGAEIAVKEITDRISDIEFDLITLRFEKEHPGKEKIGNCTIYRISGGLGYLSKIFFVPKATLLALKLNREKHYNALWAIMTNMLFPVTLMRLFGNRTPYILTLQDGDPFEYVFKRLRIRIFLPLLKYGFSHANKIQAISSFLAKWATQIGYKGKVEIIPNGVNVEKFKSGQHSVLTTGNVVLITTSRLIKKNAVEDIINALKLLSSSVKLKILGVGSLEKSLKLKANSLKLADRVEFVGFVSQDDIPKYLHNADIFIRPSLSEGQGISFIEAMAAGLPVIATPVGGIPDFLVDEGTGLFCEINNPKSIADKVMKYVNNPELTSKIVQNARKMVEEKYDWNLIARDMRSKVFDVI
jgi:glycosyltransferase involved in cell wall biosynthesis